MAIDRDAVERVIELLNESGVGEIEVRSGDLTVRVARAAATPEAAEQGPSADEQPGEMAQGGAEEAPEAAGEIEYVTAGLVGLFHAGRAPDEVPIVTVGDEVEEGQVIGTIEALRKLTDVVAPCDGVLAEVLVDDGEAVQYGDRLFAIRVEGGK